VGLVPELAEGPDDGGQRGGRRVGLKLRGEVPDKGREERVQRPAEKPSAAGTRRGVHSGRGMAGGQRENKPSED